MNIFESRLVAPIMGGTALMFPILLTAFTLVVMLVTVRPSQAETITALDELFSKTNWGADDGMPNCDVHAVCRANDGFLWLATNEALVRFDGLQFQSRMLIPGDARETISDVIQDSPGTLLVAGPAIGLLQVKGDQISPHPALAGHGREKPIAALLREADGIIWLVFSDGSARRWERGKAENFPAVQERWQGAACGVVRTADGRIYVNRGAGLEVYENGSLHTEQGIFDSRLVICASEAGELWLATRLALFRMTEGKLVKQADFPAESLGPTAIRESHGVVWLGLLGVGLTRLENHRLLPVSTSHRLIRNLYDDGDGNLWIGTGGGGLDRIRASRFSILAADVADTIGTVCEDPFGNVWTGNSTGIWRIREGQMEAVAFAPSGRAWANCLCPDGEGNIWIGTYGIWRVPAGSAGGPLQGAPVLNSPNIEVLALYRARDGSMWAGGTGGPLYRFRERLSAAVAPPLPDVREMACEVESVPPGPLSALWTPASWDSSFVAP